MWPPFLGSEKNVPPHKIFRPPPPHKKLKNDTSFTSILQLQNFSLPQTYKAMYGPDVEVKILWNIC